MSEYRLPDHSVILVLDEPPYAGAEIEVRLGVGLKVYLASRSWLERFREATAGSDDEQLAIETAYGLFVSEGFIGWNLADHAGPVPQTIEGMLRLPLMLALEILTTWLSAIAQVPVPLGSESPAGEPERPTRLPASQLGRPKAGTPSPSTGDSSNLASRRRSRTAKTPTSS